jgi:hypothetical protein
MFLCNCIAAYLESQFFQQTVTSCPQLFKEMLLRNGLSALPQLIAKCGQTKTLRKCKRIFNATILQLTADIRVCRGSQHITQSEFWGSAAVVPCSPHNTQVNSSARVERTAEPGCQRISNLDLAEWCESAQVKFWRFATVHPELFLVPTSAIDSLCTTNNIATHLRKTDMAEACCPAAARGLSRNVVFIFLHGQNF